MKVFALVPICLLTAGVAAQDFLTGLSEALRQAGLNGLSTAAASAAQTQGGQALVAELQKNETFTVYAPTDEAFARVPQNVSSNNDLLASILSYHVTRGNFSAAALNVSATNITIARTLLNSTSLTNLESGKAQVLALFRGADQQVRVLNQGESGNTNLTVSQTANFRNIVLQVIPSVLTPPAGLGATLSRATAGGSLAPLRAILEQTPYPASNGTSSTALDALSSTRGFTLFAPSSAALTAAASQLAQLGGNVTVLLRNHIINGTSDYSSNLLAQGASFTSAAGQGFSLSSNASGVWVASGNSPPAKVLRSDVLTSNGVVHVIDGVLVNVNSDEKKASDAYASATSIAAKPTSSSGPVGNAAFSPRESPKGLMAMATTSVGIMLLTLGWLLV